MVSNLLLLPYQLPKGTVIAYDERSPLADVPLSGPGAQELCGMNKTIQCVQSVATMIEEDTDDTKDDTAGTTINSHRTLSSATQPGEGDWFFGAGSSPTGTGATGI